MSAFNTPTIAELKSNYTTILIRVHIASNKCNPLFASQVGRCLAWKPASYFAVEQLDLPSTFHGSGDIPSSRLPPSSMSAPSMAAGSGGSTAGATTGFKVFDSLFKVDARYQFLNALGKGSYGIVW